jgi:3-oxoacyl-[acyl-carrier protein] reductase
MKDKVCIVTGATRGIGRAVLELLVKGGATVIGTYRDSQSEAENMCMDMPIDMHRVDVRKRGDIQKLMEHVGQVYGRVDVIVNNAGYWEKGTLASIKSGQIDDMFNTHCHGPMWMVKYAQALLANKSSIVNITSMGGQVGGTEAPHYAAAKAAQISWTKSLSKMLAPKTRVNAVAPGWISTKLHEGNQRGEVPLQRWGAPEEVAWAVEFLASERSGYTTGHILNVNGGAYV